MPPTDGPNTQSKSALLHDQDFLLPRRHAEVLSSFSVMSPSQNVRASGRGNGLSVSALIGIAVAGGCVIVAIAAILVIKLLRKRTNHKKSMAELESRAVAQEPCRIVELHHTNIAMPWSKFQPQLAPAYWGIWYSTGNTIAAQQVATNQGTPVNHDINSLSRWKSWRTSRKDRSRPNDSTSGTSTQHAAVVRESVSKIPATPAKIQEETTKSGSTYCLEYPTGKLHMGSQSLPKVRRDTVAPGNVSRTHLRAGRSASTGALPGSTSREVVKTAALPGERPPTRGRSLSFGAATTKPPSCPVPPIPTIKVEHVTENIAQQERHGLCQSSVSSNSLESTSSDILATSPLSKSQIWKMKATSPTKQMHQANSATLPLSSVAAQRRPQSPPTPWDRLEVKRSISTIEQGKSHVNTVTQKRSMEQGKRASRSSIDAERSYNYCLSVPEIVIADQISMRRISSSTSLGSACEVKKVCTPSRKRTSASPTQYQRVSTTANGSPMKRGTIDVLYQADYHAETTDLIMSTPRWDQRNGKEQRSMRPFFIATPLQPQAEKSPLLSAMKGSPYARKDQRKQHIVRISTLTPEILGPPASSPCRIYEIEEESDHASTCAEVGCPPSKVTIRFRGNETGVTPKTTAFDMTPIKTKGNFSRPSFSNPSVDGYNPAWKFPRDSKLINEDSNTASHEDRTREVSPACASLTSIYSDDIDGTEKPMTDPFTSPPAETQTINTPPLPPKSSARQPSTPSSFTPASHPLPPPIALPPPTPPTSRNNYINPQPSIRIPSPLRFSATNATSSRGPTSPPPPTSPRSPIRATPPAASSSPRGPRNPPARSMLRNVMMLRRMNSDVSFDLRSPESRRYVRMGREASPMLPWVFGGGEENEGDADDDDDEDDTGVDEELDDGEEEADNTEVDEEVGGDAREGAQQEEEEGGEDEKRNMERDMLGDMESDLERERMMVGIGIGIDLGGGRSS